MTSSVEVNDVQLSVTVLNDHKWIMYLAFASLTFLVYDTILTFDQEYELYWKTRWNFVKVLYLCIRYIGIIILSVTLCITFLTETTRVCDKWFIGTVLGAYLVPTMCDIVMMLRVYSLYERSRKILIFLITSSIILFGASIAFFFAGNNSPASNPDLIEHGCFVTVYPPLSTGCLVPSLISALIVLVLTIYKVWDIIRSRNQSEGVARYPPLLRALFEQSILYFAGVWLVYSFNIFSLFFFPASVASIFVGPTIAFLSGVSSRLLLTFRSSPLASSIATSNRPSRQEVTTSPIATSTWRNAIIATIIDGPWSIDDRLAETIELPDIELSVYTSSGDNSGSRALRPDAPIASTSTTVL